QDRRHRARRLFRGNRRRRGAGADRAGGGCGRSRPVELRRRGVGEVRSAGADLGQDHHLRRPRHAEGGELQDLYRAGGRQARRGDGRLARRGRRRLCAERLAGRADRQGRRPRSLHCGRNFRRHSASGGYEGLESDRRHQQGRGGADLPGRRLRPRRRSLSGAAGTHRRIGQDRQIAGRPARLPRFGCAKMNFNIEKVGIVGAGQMGSGIAYVCAQSGFEVKLNDVAEERIIAALATINGLLSRQVAKGQIDEAGRKAVLDRIAVTGKLEDLGGCDIVIEAASENEETKRRIFQNLRPFLKNEAIVASNTSSISITRLASVTANPEQFIGIHFMNPVPKMQLVELIRGIATRDDTYDAVKTFVAKLGKTATMSEDFPAFIVNRILLPMINEAVYTLYEGVGSVESIDTAMRLGANHPMGPLQLADFIGLDTCLAVMQVLHEGLADSKYRPCPLLVKYVEAGWLGRKTQRGFYDYRGETPVPTR